MATRFIVHSILLSFAALCQSQVPNAPGAGPSAAHPVTAADFFTLARQQSDIHQDGANPFQLTATFITTDEKGHARTGQYSEIWISNSRWKREVGIGDYREASSNVSGNYYRFATEGHIDRGAAEVFDNITPDVPTVDHVDDINKNWSAKATKNGGVELVQVSRMTHAPDGGNMLAAAYYFSPETGYVRAAQSVFQTASYNGMHAGLGRIVPYNITVKFESKRSCVITINSFKDPGNPPDEAFLIPGASKSKSYTGTVTYVASDVMNRLCIKKAEPHYPEVARAAHRSGDVEMRITVGRDGRVRDIQIVGFPSADLADSAVTAIGQNRYKPYELGGVPIDVITTVIVHYRTS